MGTDGRLYGANETGQIGHGYWKDDDTLIPLDREIGIIGKRSVFVLDDNQQSGGNAQTAGILSGDYTLKDVVNIGYNWANGQDVTASQAADLAIGAGLILLGGTVAVFSAPAALIAVGAYGVLDSVGAFDGIKESLGGNTVIIEGFGGL